MAESSLIHGNCYLFVSTFDNGRLVGHGGYLRVRLTPRYFQQTLVSEQPIKFRSAPGSYRLLSSQWSLSSLKYLRFSIHHHATSSPFFLKSCHERSGESDAEVESTVSPKKALVKQNWFWTHTHTHICLAYNWKHDMAPIKWICNASESSGVLDHLTRPTMSCEPLLLTKYLFFAKHLNHRSGLEWNTSLLQLSTAFNR